ncbi:MAG: hypothetical protein ACE5HE_14740, partial [Phycisphaerae bacterium]
QCAVRDSLGGVAQGLLAMVVWDPSPKRRRGVRARALNHVDSERFGFVGVMMMYPSLALRARIAPRRFCRGSPGVRTGGNCLTAVSRACYFSGLTTSLRALRH